MLGLPLEPLPESGELPPPTNAFAEMSTHLVSGPLKDLAAFETVLVQLHGSTTHVE